MYNESELLIDSEIMEKDVVEENSKDSATSTVLDSKLEVVETTVTEARISEVKPSKLRINLRNLL